MMLARSAGAFVAGVAVAFAAGISLEDRWLLLVLCTLGAVLGFYATRAIRRHQRAMVSLALFLFITGILRGASAAETGPNDWSNIPDDGERVSITAWLSDDAAPAGNGARLTLTVIEVNGKDAGFPLTVFSSGLSDVTRSGRSASGYRYGDVYELTGRFSTATGRFAEDSAGTVFTGFVSLVAADHGNPVRRSVAVVREWLSARMQRTLTEPSSSLARTMLLNDRTGLSQDLNLDFRGSGTSHILAISGLHVSLIGGLALAAAAALLGRRGQYYLLAPLTVTWAYAALAGFSPSVTRAAIMFSVLLLARALGRQNSSLPAIGLAAAVMVAVDPEIIRSLSFQLSFAAIAGISLLAPRITSAISQLSPRITLATETNPVARSLVATVSVSLAATLATWPLVALNFGGAPVWGGAATIVMLPVVPLIIVFGGLSALAGGISTAAGEVIGWPAWILGEFVAGTARLFSDLPPGLVETPGWSAVTAIAAYVAIFGAFEWKRITRFLRPNFNQHRPPAVRLLFRASLGHRGIPAWALLSTVVIASVMWIGAASSLRDQQLTVIFFETDRGDMVLIQTPNGNTALIDGGRDPYGAVRQLDSALPFWDRSLDLLLVTHPDADHIGGLQAVVERYDVGLIAEAPTEHASTVHAAWRRSMTEHTNHAEIAVGSLFALDDGVTLEVLSAGRPFADASINDASVVTMLRYGDLSLLLTGDITSIAERRLIESASTLHATVLKVPHHGSDTSSTTEFLDAVDPLVAIVQVGSDNQFGHPADAVMERLISAVGEQNLFITSRDGNVTVRSDGHSLSIESAR